jgi:Mlc titration factor MtfA (ptsG expression regulator)
MLRPKVQRRQRVREQPFPAAWRKILEETVPLYRRLPPADREELHGHIQVLLAEKHFEGAEGLDVTDCMKLVVLAQAAVLLLHRTTDYFPKLVSVLLYPDEYSVQEDVETDDGLVSKVTEARVGESWSTGTLILSWEDVEHELASDQQSVVLHEFAHQLDVESGNANGAPILADRELRKRWADTMTAAFERLVAAEDQDDETLLDPYGAEDPAEFFAVATEAFFLVPSELKAQEPNLYAILCDYFHQDPSQW